MEVTDLVPGDVVRLELGMIVPADLRVVEATNISCDEAILTGEAEAVAKSIDPVSPDLAAADRCPAPSWAPRRREGTGIGIVVATGGATTFGRIALGLGERQPETAFEIGLRRFSLLLARVAAVLTGSILPQPSCGSVPPPTLAAWQRFGRRSLHGGTSSPSRRPIQVPTPRRGSPTMRSS